MKIFRAGIALLIMLGGDMAFADTTSPILPAMPPPVPANTTATLVRFSALAGWQADNHARAWSVWLASCRSQADNKSSLRTGVDVPAQLAALCRKALAVETTDKRAARLFFEHHFAAWRIRPKGGKAFFTGYYEPELQGSLTRGGVFQIPLFDRPDDLISFDMNAIPQGMEGYSAGRRRADGGLEPYPDRKAIDEGFLEGRGLERAYVSDPVERFFMQVQGSGRLRLPDGRLVRMLYAGRNGQPYTGIGKIVAERLNVAPAQITMKRLYSFLAQDPATAREVMHQNRSFVFFRLDTTLAADSGPIGGEGLPVTPMRSIAIDRNIWPYGLPVFVDTAIPDVAGVKPEKIRSLMIAQDTGSAIIGPARADIFFGSGPQAGARAGAVRHRGEFYVLWPRGAVLPAGKRL